MKQFYVVHVAMTCALISLGGSFNVSIAAEKSDFPARPIRLVLGFSPGGGSDAVARTIAPKLYQELGQPWVVDNRPGAGGSLATAIVAQSAPDGYTVLMGFSTTLTATPLLSKVPYNVLRDFRPVINIAEGRYVLVVHPSLKARSVRELVALAKAKPGVINYGASGLGSAAHLEMELFKATTGIDLVPIQYKGGGPLAVALLAGEVQVSFASLPSVVSHIGNGRLIPLAVTGAKRTSLAPNIPTLGESGFPGYETTSWYGFLVPAKTPNRIVKTLFEAARKALQLPDVREQYARQGLEVITKGPKEFAEQIKSETDAWSKVIKTMHIKFE